MRDPNATATPERGGLRSWRIPAFVAVVVVCVAGALFAISRGGTSTGGGTSTIVPIRRA